MTDQEGDDLLSRLANAVEKRLEAIEKRKAERRSFMDGRYIYHKGRKYKVIEWDREVKTDPDDTELVELLRATIKMSFPPQNASI